MCVYHWHLGQQSVCMSSGVGVQESSLSVIRSEYLRQYSVFVMISGAEKYVCQ